MNDLQQLADVLFPAVHETPADLEKKYPPRNLPAAAPVTRFAPSPTGYMHIGGLLAALVSERFAHQTGGIFFLRIEDTDKEREVAGGIEEIVSSFNSFGIHYDEGAVSSNEEKGAYGPYTQSKRAALYHVYVKELVAQGKAYPCFCTEDEIAAIRKEQEAQGSKTGVYGTWAKHRTLSTATAAQYIAEKKPYVIRLKSAGVDGAVVQFNDLIRGTISMPQNDFDVVLLKQDGIPTYHFAHAVDDHLMRTTHVIRGEEWLPSVPLHYELFDTLGFSKPQYAHISPIMKDDNGSRRKLSKRHDPEAAVSYYHQQGYPAEAVIEYLMNIIDSSFERWRLDNPAAAYTDFRFDIASMSTSGGLFDLQKLRDVSQNYIPKLSAQEVTARVLAWAKQYDTAFADLIESRIDYTTAVFSIGRNDPKARKDIRVWSDAKAVLAFFYDEYFAAIPERDPFPAVMTPEKISAFINAYLAAAVSYDDRHAWMEKITAVAVSIGFAPDAKAYKKAPQDFAGQPGDLMMTLRILVAKKKESPDLFQMLAVMGAERIQQRLTAYLRMLTMNEPT